MNDKGKEKEEDAPTETRGGSEEKIFCTRINIRSQRAVFVVCTM